MVSQFLSADRALRKLRQEDHEFEASLGYIERPSLKEKKNPSKGLVIEC
jgi:hypothetical protein